MEDKYSAVMAEIEAEIRRQCPDEESLMAEYQRQMYLGDWGYWDWAMYKFQRWLLDNKVASLSTVPDTSSVRACATNGVTALTVQVYCKTTDGKWFDAHIARGLLCRK